MSSEPSERTSDPLTLPPTPLCSQLRPVEKTFRKGRGEGLAGAALDRREHLVDVVLVPSLGGRWRRMRGLPKAGRSLTELVSAGLSRAALDLPKPRKAGPPESPAAPPGRPRPDLARDQPATRPRPAPRGPPAPRLRSNQAAWPDEAAMPGGGGERRATATPGRCPRAGLVFFPVANQLRISCELVAIYVFSSCELFSE